MVSDSLKSSALQISMVSYKGIVNRESTSKLSIKQSGCWSTTFYAKLFHLTYFLSSSFI